MGYQGTVYNSCATVAPPMLGLPINAPWCSVTSDLDKHGLWGYCGETGGGGSGLCDGHMTRHQLMHALGAIPMQHASGLQHCLDLCLCNPQCKAVDWNFTMTPYQSSQCWHHVGSHDGVIPND